MEPTRQALKKKPHPYPCLVFMAQPTSPLDLINTLSRLQSTFPLCV